MMVSYLMYNYPVMVSYLMYNYVPGDGELLNDVELPDDSELLNDVKLPGDIENLLNNTKEDLRKATEKIVMLQECFKVCQ